MINNITQSKSKDLVQYITALNNINFQPSEQFISKWFIKATDDIDNFNSQALSNSIYALSQLGITPEQSFLGRWFIKATDDIDNFNSQALANSIYALSKLGYQNSNVTILLQNTQAHNSHTSNVALMGDYQQDIDYNGTVNLSNE